MQGLHIRWLLIAALLAASRPVAALDDQSYAYAVPTGSTVVLRQALRVEVGEAAAYLQGGRQVGQHGGDKYLPTCRFRIKGGKDEPRVIEPDTFKITDVRRDYTIVQAPRERSPTGQVRVGADPTYEIYGVELDLQSAQQPAVWSLTCEELYGWGDFSAWHITLGRVRQALGDIAEIRIAQ
jgi:hypothetical protein